MCANRSRPGTATHNQLTRNQLRRKQGIPVESWQWHKFVIMTDFGRNLSHFCPFEPMPARWFAQRSVRMVSSRDFNFTGVHA